MNRNGKGVLGRKSRKRRNRRKKKKVVEGGGWQEVKPEEGDLALTVPSVGASVGCPGTPQWSMLLTET